MRGTQQSTLFHETDDQSFSRAQRAIKQRFSAKDTKDTQRRRCRISRQQRLRALCVSIAFFALNFRGV
jgi:hypothetical protein